MTRHYRDLGRALIGLSKFHAQHDQSETLPRSGEPQPTGFFHCSFYLTSDWSFGLSLFAVIGLRNLLN